MPTERQVYRAVRNFIINECGISKASLRAEVAQIASDAVRGQRHEVEAAIDRHIGKRVAGWRYGGAPEFRRALDEAIAVEVQRVVGAEVRRALAGLAISVRQEVPNG